MGTVYLARDRVRDLPVALKTVSRADAGRIAHLKREFRAVAGLRHPNLVELHELFAEPGGCFFTMELIEGVDPRAWSRGPSPQARGDDGLTHAALYDATLSQAAEPTESDPQTPEVTPSLGSSGKVRPGRPPPGPVPLDEARLRSLLAQLADGLAFLHGRGVVHRDVKASNALVRRDGRVKLLDFGLAFDWRTAVQAGKARAPTSGPLVGTVTYMAPEYLHGHRVSPAMDLYALGVLAFELVCGAPPFDGSFYEIVAAHVEQRAPRALAFNPAVPDDLDELIAMLLIKDPAVRPSAEEVAEIARAEAPVARRVARPRSRFVGRDAELGGLVATVAEVRDGVPRLTVVAGPSGAGKTALCDQLLDRVPLRGVLVWRGRCYERERVPYRAFDQIVDTLAAELDDAGEVIDDLPHAAALARVFPSLAAVAGPSVRELGPAVSDLRVERDRAFAALATLLRRRLGGRIGVCVIDDLQWADVGSLELIEVLLAQRGWPLLVVATCTTDDDGALPAAPRALLDRLGSAASGQASTIALDALPDGKIAELIRSVAPLASAEVVAEVVRAAAGSPYLAELVATEVLADGVSGGASVAGAELRRVARMSPSEQVVAEASAVAGGTVSFARLRDVTELDGPMLQSALRALELERVLRTVPSGVGGDVGYDFYHHRLRREVYGGIATPSRRELHRRFATWYLAHAGDRPERAALAMHWEQAGEPARAAPWALAAADAAMDQLAFDHAASWYQRAADLGLAPADHRRACERAAEALLWSGDFRKAASACRSLADQRDGAERERWLVRAAEAEIKLGELGAGLALIDRILLPRGLHWRGRRVGGVLRTAAVAARLAIRRDAPAGRRGGDEALAGAYRVVASFLSTPRPVESFEYVLRSVELARRRGDLAGQGMGLAMIAGYLAAGTLGWLGDSVLTRSSALSHASADPYARMVSEAAAGMLATSRGRWDDMRAAHDRGERICRDLGLERSWEASFLRSYWTLGELYAGEIDRAVGLAESLLERTGDLFSRAMIGSFRGRALAAAGRTTEAAAALAALVRDPAAEQGMPRMYRYALEGELALATGRWRDAVAIADEMGGVARAEWLWLMPAVAVMRDVIAATGELGVARAGGHDALAAARRCRALARRLGRRSRASFYAPTALRLEAQAEALLGHVARGRALLLEAARVAQLRGGRVERAAIDGLLGGVAPADDLRAAVAWATAGAVS